MLIITSLKNILSRGVILLDYKNNIINGNCIEEMKKIDNECIDLIITDPPYIIDYKSNYRKEKHKKIENDKNGEHIIKDSLYEMHRVLKENSCIYMFCSWHKIDFFKSEFEKFFKLKNIIVWNKNSTSMGDLKGSYAPKYEFILFGHKGRRLMNGFRYPDVIECKKTKNIFHPTEKPVDLLKIFIESSSNKNDIVLDPFSGSGSTALASKMCERNFICIEIDKEYVDISKKRVGV